MDEKSVDVWIHACVVTYLLFSCIVVVTIVLQVIPSTVDEDAGTVSVIVRAVGVLQREITLK
jgi:hypothetical protein